MMLPQYREEAALRLKVAAGHLDAVRRMVEEDGYCIDLMKQLSAVQGTLRRVQQVFLRNHLSSCVSDAVKNGMGEAIIDELMTALKYDSSLVDGRGLPGTDPLLAGLAAGTGPAVQPCCGHESDEDVLRGGQAEGSFDSRSATVAPRQGGWECPRDR